MNQQEKVRLIVTATAMFITGHIVGDLKAQYCIARENKKLKTKKLGGPDNNAFAALTKWLNDASDKRTFDEVMEDWTYNKKFETSLLVLRRLNNVSNRRQPKGTH
jgi:hypothetical protein